MTFEAFIADNIVWVITAAFGAGGFYWLTKSLIRRLDEHELRMLHRFDRLDAKDDEHDQAIGQLKVRMARQEERTELLMEIRAQVSDIWKHIMRQNGA